MDFLKKHYEKVILGLVLLGLAIAAAFLPFVISSEQQKLDAASATILNPSVKPLTNLDLGLAEGALKRVAAPAVIDFGPPNRLFNPMPWQKTADGKLVPSQKLGPTALVVTNITALFLTLSLDAVNVSETGPKYIIGIEKPGASGATKSKTQDYCTINPPSKNKTFVMVEVKGKPEDPTQIVVKLNDTGELALITKEKPYRRIEGYMADLRYEPERKHWEKRRANMRGDAPLAFNGEEYNIVAINQNEVVLSAKSNGKKWTIKANPNPAA